MSESQEAGGEKREGRLQKTLLELAKETKVCSFQASELQRDTFEQVMLQCVTLEKAADTRPKPKQANVHAKRGKKQIQIWRKQVTSIRFTSFYVFIYLPFFKFYYNG